MTPDDETLIAYADGELDPVAAKRVERAMADDPALAGRVARERALRARLAGAFAGIAEEPVPAALTDRLAANVVPIHAAAPRRRWWPQAAAIAATLLLGIGVGRQWPGETLVMTGDRLAAQGELGRALDGDLSGGTGPIRVVASFRASESYCRVFATRAADGIACRDAEGWTVRRLQSAAPAVTAAYRQASAPAPDMMAAAQDMMTGEPFDAARERVARDRGWRP